MSDVTIKKLLELQLNTLSAGVATAFENAPFTPVIGTPWQEAFFLPAKTEVPTMGDGFKREKGILQITVNYPQKNGAQSALTRADVLKAGFPRGLTLVEGSLRVLIDEHPFTSQGRPNGVWYSVPVSVPYVVDVYG